MDSGFAFDPNESSDRILRIEIVSSSPETSPHAHYAKKEPGDEAPDASCCSGNTDSPMVLRVNTLHISSAILAAKSKFISKLFSNGKEVLDHELVTIQIKDSEEADFMELLNFMYNNTLSSTTAPKLLNILMVAKKFEVDLCMRYCIELLSNIPMTTELALLYLELLPKITAVETAQLLTDASKLFLRSLYKDVTKSEDELMGLPLSGIEVILSADDLHVSSEDDVFDFVLKWANAHYPKLEERRQILCSRLIKYIRFPYMSSHRLLEVPKRTDLDKQLAFVSVHNALVSKLDALIAKASFLQNISPITMDNSSSGATNASMWEKQV